MKKKLFLCVILAATFFSCQKYDDSALRNDINDLRSRIILVEELCASLNTNISSLQTIVTALQNNDYITSYAELADKSGYQITFAKGGAVIIKHGTNGKDGTNGTNGNTPIISVDAEGYWIINGTRIQSDGQDVKAIGEDGTNGSEGNKGADGLTPVIGVDVEGYWTVTIGETTQRIKDSLGQDIQAVGKDGTDGIDGANGDSFFKDIIIQDNKLVITLNDSDSNPTVISLPLYQPLPIFTVKFDSNGGDNVDLQTVIGGDTAIAPTSPTKDGYIFAGWYIDNDSFVYEWEFSRIVITNLILYAKWDAIKVGDYYNFNGVQGVVYKVVDEGHGMIVSLDETYVRWGGGGLGYPPANDYYDGQFNMACIKGMLYWQGNYPTFEWCDAKNRQGITGWYFPALNELREVLSVYEQINDALSNNGGVPFGINKRYWCSTEVNALYANYYYISLYQSFDHKNTSCYVRAIKAF